MNKGPINHLQYEYLIEQDAIKQTDMKNLVIAATSGMGTYGLFINEPGVLACAAGLGLGYIAVRQSGGLLFRQVLKLCGWLEKRKITPETSFANAEEILFEDAEGLEMLLAKTMLKSEHEWGTPYTARQEKNKAIIQDIMQPEEAEEKGIVKRINPEMLRTDINMFKEYNGFQHYHPEGGAGNFEVNIVDRTKPRNLINLLTFNMPYGPEIIGYNLNHTYIPAKREDKTKLVRATREDILRYLGQSQGFYTT